MLDTAYHEAGRAVVARLLGYELTGISIASEVPGKLGHSGSNVLPDSLKESNVWKRDVVTPEEWNAACDDVVIDLAGATAEERLRGQTYELDPNNPRSSDETEIVGRIGRMCGTDYAEQDRLLAELTAKAAELVDQHWQIIIGAADALVAQTSMTGQETQALIGGLSAAENTG